MQTLRLKETNHTICNFTNRIERLLMKAIQSDLLSGIKQSMSDTAFNQAGKEHAVMAV